MNSGRHNKRIIFMRSTSVRFEPVIARKAGVAVKSGLDTVVVYWDRQGGEQKYFEAGVAYLPIFVGKTAYGKGINNIFKRVYSTVRFVQRLMNLQPDIIHACDLDMVFPALLYQKLVSRRVAVVYDILDFIQDFSSLIPTPVQKLMSTLDRWAQNKCNAIILADDNRMSMINSQFYNKLTVIYNTPEILCCPLPSTKHQNSRFKILYIGGLSTDRGIMMLLEAASRFPDTIDVVIGGQGILSNDVQMFSEKYDNIKYVGQLNYDEVLLLTAESDVLYAVYNPEYQVNKVASPNKFFEAIALGKPIIVAEGTSIDQKVHQLGMGYTVLYDLEQLSKLLEQFDYVELQQKGANALKAYDLFNWPAMEARLFGVYSKLKEGK